MGPFGIVVIAVLVASVVVALVLFRRPSPWDEIGADGLGEPTPNPADSPPASVSDDEAELRALIERKREARRARGQPDRPRALPARGLPWSHMDDEVVEEARALVARRRERLARQGKPDVDVQDELERLLGPPHV